jgi:hypothetical protein
MWWGKSLRANLSEPTNQGRYSLLRNVYENLQSPTVQSIYTQFALLDFLLFRLLTVFSFIYKYTKLTC